MNKREDFDNALSNARKILEDRARRVSPENNLIRHLQNKFDHAERLADGGVLNNGPSDDMDLAYVADREIASMDPEFAIAIKYLREKLFELTGA